MEMALLILSKVRILFEYRQIWQTQCIVTAVKKPERANVLFTRSGFPVSLSSGKVPADQQFIFTFVVVSLLITANMEMVDWIFINPWLKYD
jgi:hypothetical protein